jgi:ABC-type lipoprotein release transport system permease subunit
VAAGLAVGLAAALALGRLMASQLYQTSSRSPLLAATAVTLGLAALLACIVPARRATLVNPVDTFVRSDGRRRIG